MEITHFDDSERISAGPVKAEVVKVEDDVTTYGECVVFYFNVTDMDGKTLDGMRVYCSTPSLVPLSKLGKIVRALVPKVTQKTIGGIKTTENLNKVATGRTVTLEAYENDAGYMRLRLPGASSLGGK